MTERHTHARADVLLKILQNTAQEVVTVHVNTANTQETEVLSRSGGGVGYILERYAGISPGTPGTS